MALLERLAQRQLLVVTGKGGVGKTMVAAALGSALADRGRRVLLLEVDPRENLHEVFDVPPSGGDVVPVAPLLSLQNLQPQRVIAELVRQHLRIELLSRRVVNHQVFRHFVESAPGLKEVAVIAHAERVARPHAGRQPAVDTVVLDAPATGHGLSLLRAPLLVSEAITRGPIGHEARHLARLIAAPDRTGVVVVTRAEETPVQETIELGAALFAHVGRSPDVLVVNALYPHFPRAPIRPGHDGVLLQLWQTRRQVNDAQLARLTDWWHGPRVDLPMLAAERGPGLLVALKQHLTEQMEHAA